MKTHFILLSIVFSCQVIAKIPILSELSPIFSKGQNIMPKDSFTHYNYLFYTEGKQGFSNTTLSEEVVLAPSDKFSILFGFPITRLVLNQQRSTGLGDIYVQTETELYGHKTSNFYMYSSLILGAFLPTGSGNLTRNVIAPYIGGTTNYNTRYFYAFGVWLFVPSTTKNHIKAGANFYYEGGFGIPLIYKPKFLAALITQINGLYTQKGGLIHTFMNETSGTDFLLIGPTIQVMTHQLKFQVGFQYPIFSQSKVRLQTETFRVAAGISYFVVFG